MKLVTRKLDSRAIDYIRDTLLEEGNTLSKLFISNQQLSLGNVFTIVPQNTSEESLYHFNYSIMPPGKKRKVKLGKQYVIVEEVQTTRDWLIHWLYNQLKVSPNLITIFEGDFVFESSQCLTSLMTYRREVYYYVIGGKDVKVKSIKCAINMGKAFPKIGFVVSLNQDLLSTYKKEKKVKIKKKDLELFSQNIKIAIVGAYDFESFIIWERK